jgi:hypothetical protein
MTMMDISIRMKITAEPRRALLDEVESLIFMG